MLSLILWIGKAIGILLLALLALFLLILLLVLVVPIRYRFEAEYDVAFSGTGWLRWFYPVLDAEIQIEANHPKVMICLFGLNLEDWKARLKERQKKKKRKKRKKQAAKKKRAGAQSKSEQAVSMKNPESEKMNQTGQVPSESDKEEQTRKEQAQDDSPINTVAVEKTGKKHRILHRIREWKDRVQKAWRTLVEKLQSFWNKLVSLWGQWEKIKNLLEQEEVRTSISLIYTEFKRLLRHCKPKEVSVWLRYGTGDPYTLGQHLSALAVLYGLFGEWLEIEPDWEEQVFQLKGSMKGRIRIFTLLRICIKVLTDKNVKAVWEQLHE